MCARRPGTRWPGPRQRIPAEQIQDPVKSLVMGLPLDLQFRTKGQLAIDICADAYADGLGFDFVCGDEVYGSCTQLREFLQAREQAYVLRVASDFTLTLAAGTKLTCAEAAVRLLKDKRRREVRSAGLRWPAEEDFESGKDCFGLDQCQVRLCTAIARHVVLVMAALAICAVTAALLKTAPAPRRRRQPGLISCHPPNPG